MTGLNKAASAYGAIVALFLSSGVAIAQAPVVIEAELPRAMVTYADLDIGSTAGLVALQMRVKSAAARLCLHNGTQSLGERAERSRCFDDAIASADTQIAQAVADRGTRLAGRKAIEVALRK